MNWYLATVADGKVVSVEALEGERPEGTQYVLVKAKSLERATEKALKKAMSMYAAQKRREKRKRHAGTGQCMCGRKRDRVNEKTGELFITCSVCCERQKVWNKGRNERQKAGVTDHRRDEASRVAVAAERHRDRRKELKLEALIEVRTKFWELSVREFGKWVEQSIEELTKT